MTGYLGVICLAPLQMNENAQRQFSISYAFALTAIVAIGIVVFLEFQQRIGTGIAIPFAVWTAVMSLLFVQVLFRVRKRTFWQTLLGSMIFLLGTIPIFYPSAVLPDYELRVSSYANTITLNEQFERIVSAIDDPEVVLAASRELRSILMELPESDRRINGDSDLIPPALSKLEPIAIHANKNVLTLHLFRNYEKSYGLFAYSDDYNLKQVGTKRIIDGLWWLEY